MNTVTVSMDQVAGADGSTADLDGLAKFDDVGIGVGHGDVVREELKSQAFDGGQVAHGAVGDAADTVQGVADYGVNFTDEGAEAGVMVHVFEDHDAWAGDGGNVGPPVHAVVVAAFAVQRRIRGSDAGGGGVTEHGREVGEPAGDGAGDETFVARANVEAFLGPDQPYSVQERDVYLGIDAEGLDRVVLDLAEPWLVVPHAERALAPGGILLAYLPTINQTAELRAVLDQSGFAMAETFEILRRTWHIEGRSVRPDHRMVAHTGFITSARLLTV